MRKAVKFLHTLSSCGLIGALAAYMLMLVVAPQASAAQYADMRQTIHAICTYILVPSLGVALVSGLLSMFVHRPFQEKGWAWAKALLGFAMFEATLAITQAKAGLASQLATKIAEGAQETEALSAAIASEWTSLCAIMGLAVAQTALGVWRPAFNLRTALLARMNAKP